MTDRFLQPLSAVESLPHFHHGTEIYDSQSQTAVGLPENQRKEF